MKRVIAVVVFLTVLLASNTALATEPQPEEPKQEQKSKKGWEAVKFLPLTDVIMMPFKIVPFLADLWLFKRPDWSGLPRGEEKPPCQPVQGTFPGGSFRADQCQ